MRVSRRALIAIAVAGISIGVSSLLAGPAYSAGVPRAAVRPAATAYSTVGGLNEQCYAVFRDRSGVAFLEAAMGAVLGRIRAPSTKNTQEGEAP